MHRLSLLPLLVALCACGSDPSVSPDAQPDARSADASEPDASEPDAFNACPGMATFQVGVVDWMDGGNLAGIQVSDGTTQRSSAPNGRVVLCVPSTGPLTIRFSHADYIDRVHSTTGELVAEMQDTAGVDLFRLLKPADADDLYTGAGSTRQLGQTTFVAMVRDRATGEYAAEASIALAAASEGSFTPGASPGELVAGQVTASDGRVLFLNADAGSSTVTATGLPACVAPATVELEAGAISSATIACSP